MVAYYAATRRVFEQVLTKPHSGVQACNRKYIDVLT